MNLDRFRLAGWIVSGLSLTLSSGLIVTRHVAFVQAHRRDDRLEAELIQARTKDDALSHARAVRRMACAPRQAREETAFLAGLRRHASLAGVAIVRLGSHASTYEMSSAAGGPPSTDGTDEILAGVTKIGTDLTLDGSYAGLRRFLQGFWEADRLYTVSNVGWSRADNGSELTLTLNRYVAPEPSKP